MLIEQVKPMQKKKKKARNKPAEILLASARLTLLNEKLRELLENKKAGHPDLLER